MHTCKGHRLVFLCCVAVMLFQEVWGKSFCRTIEKLVEVVQEYPGEVEHIFSPTCVPLVRCAGCCGDENLECHPTLTSNTTMQVRIFPLTRLTIFSVSKVAQEMVPIIMNASSYFHILDVSFSKVISIKETLFCLCQAHGWD
uniref:Placental growth factor b n=1 Tax=Cyprinus carpio TaxID=7962 RepID=A0A8C1NSJ1_CYPCA